MTAVLKHELRGYAHSLSSYLFCAFLLLFVGVGALLYNIQSAVANFEYVLEFVCIGLTVIIPVLTMRVIAEERRARTDQLLYLLPLTTAQIVAGKYLALLVVYLVPLCIVALGAYSTMDAQRYVSTGDGKVYLAATDPMELFSTELSRMIKNDTTPDIDCADEIRFTGGDEYTVTYDASGEGSVCADDVYFADGAAQSFTLAISKNAQELSVAEKNGEDAADVQAYARVGDSPIVYEISADSYDRLMAAGYDDLRHRELFAADFSDVTAITAALDGETYFLELRADEDSKKLLSEVENVWYCGGEKIDVSALEDALVSFSAESFTDETPAGKCELSLTLALDNARFPEVSIALYRADGSRCLAAADGVTVGYVPRSEVVDLIEAVNAIVLGSPEESGSG